MYLADHNGRGAIAVGDLPDRTAADVTANVGTLALNDAEDYRDYADFIDAAPYDETQINTFVAEIASKIANARNLRLKIAN